VKALVVDDDMILADLVAFTLRKEGFQVIQAQDGEGALQRWMEEKPDIVILDVNLPKTIPQTDGFTVLQRIREKADTPIILLTVRGEEDDIIHGLKMGADDYIVKPFSPRQFIARVQTVLRRSQRGPETSLLRAGALALDTERREVRIQDGLPISLTDLENRFLEYMMLHAGHILTIRDLIAYIWGPGGGDRDMLRQLVRRLRLKIEPDPSQPVFIETVPGKGYGLKRIESFDEAEQSN
jgi:DNA-binding response OmpR family regulator